LQAVWQSKSSERGAGFASAGFVSADQSDTASMALPPNTRLTVAGGVTGTGTLEYGTHNDVSSTGHVSVPHLPRAAELAHGTPASELLIVLRKLSWYLLPVFFLLNMLNYLDRTNLAFASIQMSQVCANWNAVLWRLPLEYAWLLSHVVQYD
jgi:hypothetical protein